MKEKIIMMLAVLLVGRLDPEDLRKWIDMVLDMLEDKIETHMDDKLFLPVIHAIRVSFGIDNP